LEKLVSQSSSVMSLTFLVETPSTYIFLPLFALSGYIIRMAPTEPRMACTFLPSDGFDGIAPRSL
jgi:hypothetical protein